MRHRCTHLLIALTFGLLARQPVIAEDTPQTTKRSISTVQLFVASWDDSLSAALERFAERRLRETGFGVTPFGFQIGDKTAVVPLLALTIIPEPASNESLDVKLRYSLELRERSDTEGDANPNGWKASAELTFNPGDRTTEQYTSDLLNTADELIQKFAIKFSQSAPKSEEE